MNYFLLTYYYTLIGGGHGKEDILIKACDLAEAEEKLMKQVHNNVVKIYKINNKTIL